MLLDELGHATHVVVESPKAIAAALDFQPDVVILDIGMPHLDGFGLARAVLASSAVACAPGGAQRVEAMLATVRKSA